MHAVHYPRYHPHHPGMQGFLKELVKGLVKGFKGAFLAVGVIIASHPVAQAQARFMHEKTYLLPSGREVDVTFRERVCEKGECSETDGGTWGVDEGTPRRVADAFIVFIDGTRFVIPGKFYKDLAHTHSLKVHEQEGRIIIRLKGGDAAGAYTAHFVLGGTCGFERYVCGEVCEEIWERTAWYNSFAYDRAPGCVSVIR